MFWYSTELNMNEYFNQMMRTVVGSVIVVSQDKVMIKYVDGTEVGTKI